MRCRFSLETLDVGMDALSPVSRTYPKDEPQFPFTGAIGSVRFEFGDSVDLTPAQRVEQHLKLD